MKTPLPTRLLAMLAYYGRRLSHKLRPPALNSEEVSRRYYLLGQMLELQDYRSSFATDTIFKELQQDCYGLERMTFAPDDVVIDIGGHVGFFSILLAKLHPEIQIYAFEPIPDNYQHFQANIAHNHVTNIQLENRAITTDGRDLTLWMHPHNTGGSTAANLLDTNASAQHRVYQVPSSTLDAVFMQHGIERCRLLKIDCEGSEHEILLNTSRLPQIDYLAGEFHINNKLTHQGYSIDRLVSHCQQFIPADHIVYTACQMAE
jgi:FkbM family methyltransferase